MSTKIQKTFPFIAAKELSWSAEQILCWKSLTRSIYTPDYNESSWHLVWVAVFSECWQRTRFLRHYWIKGLRSIASLHMPSILHLPPFAKVTKIKKINKKKEKKEPGPWMSTLPSSLQRNIYGLWSIWNLFKGRTSLYCAASLVGLCLQPPSDKACPGKFPLSFKYLPEWWHLNVS